MWTYRSLWLAARVIITFWTMSGVNKKKRNPRTFLGDRADYIPAGGNRYLQRKILTELSTVSDSDHSIS
jgi:hypothetical protein